MATFTETQRHLSFSSSSPPPQLGVDDVDINKGKSAAQRMSMSVTVTWPFSIPSTPEATAARLVKNLVRFKLLYALFMWMVLAIALIPQREVSLLLLMVTGNFTLLYVLLLREMPDSVVLHRHLDKRLVAALVAIVVTVEMILTDAGVHLGIVVLSCLPVLLLHAVLVVPETYCMIEEGSRNHDDNSASYAV